MRDKQLLKQTQQGNREALDAIIRKYYRDIFHFCVRKTGDPHLAADLTQEGFLKLVKSIHHYVHEGKFKNYLFTIALNTCHDHYRKRNRGQDALVGEMQEWDSPVDDDRYRKIEQSEIIERALHALPSIQKDVVLLRFYHDLKVKDIANITGVSLATAKSRLKQGLDNLKKILREEDIL